MENGNSESALDPDAFLEELKAFHTQRGTYLDTSPRVNGKHIDLHKLFYLVIGRGGYDQVTAEKLAWRKVGQDFNLGQTNTAAYAFALKSVYYKNLAAYEIKTIHHQEPPPKEILEDITAKGGDLLSRTIVNFKPPQNRGSMGNGNDSEGSGDEGNRTPKEEKMDNDDPASGGGRTTRGLRQAPPQRQLFQPDISSTRQSRNAANTIQSLQNVTGTAGAGHAYSMSSNPNSSSFTINNYEPRPQIPLTLRPVLTPASNPTMFKEKVKRIREAHIARIGRSSLLSYQGMMLPGTGFEGPNIYTRTLLALRSGIPQEQDYALHHLVKISHERGDKFKFEAFPGLAEGLIEKALDVSSLFYEVKWEISYDYGGAHGQNVLDGVYGTPDLMDRIQRLPLRNRLDDVDPEDFTKKLSKMNEAGLVLRNLSLLEDNARYLSEQYPLRDFLTIALNLPAHVGVIELKHYALDIAEQLTKYWSLDSADPLYMSLLEILREGRDRGAILTSLRAISRIAMNLEVSNRLEGISISTIRNLIDWTLLDDEELVAACLDFFYQYTAVPENVALLLTHVASKSLTLDPLITRLGHLLLYNAQHIITKRLIAPAIPGKSATEIPELPPDLLEQIVKFSEPERSSHWLRACFEENAESEITQIALWQAYQSRFTRLSSQQNPLLVAADFIKNVSATFPTANAQVINGPNPRFIIKGIRPRWTPVSLKGQVYSNCQWITPESEKACGTFHLTAGAMWEHVVTEHLGLSRNEDLQWNFLDVKTAAALHGQKFDCYWGGCHRFGAKGGTDSPYDVGVHFKVHLPDTSAMASHRAKYTKYGSTDRIHENDSKDDTGDQHTGIYGRSPLYDYFTWYNTTTDEHGNPVGLPLTSVLVLKNLARNIPRAVTGTEGLEGGLGASHGSNGWVERLLGPLKTKLAYALAYNRPLSTYVSELVIQIQKSTTGG